MDPVFARSRRWQSARTLWASGWRLLVLSLIIVAALASSASAAEPTEDFVKSLQQRGLHELALEYLDELKTSPLANDATRKQLPYLRGEALIAKSRQSADPDTRNRLMDDARKELEHFAEANPNNVLGADAQMQLATVQMARGQEFSGQAAKLPKEKPYDGQRRNFNRDARMQFAEARDTFQRSETIYNKELEKLPPGAEKEAREGESTQRQKYRDRVAQLRYLAAQVQLAIAGTYPPEADEFTKLHKTAADELSAVYEEFSSSNIYLALCAHLDEGRCYEILGEHVMALGCFEDVLRTQYNLEPFRKLTASAMRNKAEVLIAQDKYDAAVDVTYPFLKDSHKEETTQPEWLAVRYRLAEALAKKADRVPAGSSEHKKLLAEAREEFREVAKTPGEFQVAARTGVAGKSRATGAAAGAPNKNDEPKNFQAAYDLGKEALSSYNAAKQAIPSAEKNNPPAVAELKEQMDHGKVDARRYFMLASSMIESDTDPKLVNEVRYFLCWLYWEAEDYFRAAVLGEFLARRFPDHPAASSAAKISMAAYERLYSNALAAKKEKDAGEFESERMAQMAEFIVRRWPGSSDSDTAFGVLVGVATRSGKIDDAEKMIQKASAQSRPRLELLLGNALWTRYLDLSQAGAQPPTNADELAKIQATSVKYMRDGFDAAKKESPLSDAGALAALYLVQAQLAAGSYADAIQLLEDKDAGPLKLIDKDHPTASRPQYALEAYRLALKAYVSITPPQDKKAIDTMQALEKVVKASGGDAKSAEQLNRIYIGLGTTLQKQMEDLRTAGNHKEAARLSTALATFLERVGAQQDQAWPTRAWLAQMYYAMGTADPSTQRSGSKLSKQAEDYFTKSREGYQQLLDEAKNDPKAAPSDAAVLAAKVKLGECQRMLGQYDKALDTFFDVLKAKETSLEVQRAAAIAYQERGQKEDQKFFESAIRGGYKDEKTGQNRVWGWLRISQVTDRAAKTDPKFRDSFYEARLNISKCRYLSALKQKGDARQQDLAKARQSVQSFAQLYPDLGGDRWKPEFEKLQKDIDDAEKSSDDTPGA